MAGLSQNGECRCPETLPAAESNKDSGAWGESTPISFTPLISFGVGVPIPGNLVQTLPPGPA
jgi:hypothetical protein